MRYGSTFHIEKQPGTGLTTVTTQKVRDYEEYVNETTYHERVQIMKIDDFDTITKQMHIDHALQDHGAWLEHQGGKMYVVKSWVTRNVA
jgi:carbonic anhydrase